VGRKGATGSIRERGDAIHKALSMMQVCYEGRTSRSLRFLSGTLLITLSSAVWTTAASGRIERRWRRCSTTVGRTVGHPSLHSKADSSCFADASSSMRHMSVLHSWFSNNRSLCKSALLASLPAVSHLQHALPSACTGLLYGPVSVCCEFCQCVKPLLWVYGE
jgi:hypothetical protein